MSADPERVVERVQPAVLFDAGPTAAAAGAGASCGVTLLPGARARQTTDDHALAGLKSGAYHAQSLADRTKLDRTIFDRAVGDRPRAHSAGPGR